MSHTHYDHIGALPYVLEKWPGAIVCGNEKAMHVFESQTALATMKSLGDAACQSYRNGEIKIITDGMRVDQVVKEGDVISLGDKSVRVIECKGHTDCSLAYLIEPDKVLFACESTGTLRGPGRIHTAPLKSVDDCIASAHKIKSLDYDTIIMPHYGVCPPEHRYDIIDLYLQEQQIEKELIESGIAEGLSADELFERHKAHYWTEGRAKAQPYQAYAMNAKIIIAQLLRKHAQ